ncbi:PAS domain S-box protein [Pusillimonas sp. MFBS29]|uniref:PAS domain-containing protein n=1 Tax=Pusillimonas sp. MFBS29 TaxID=2886690 RepID=UPI001D110B8E|nr:PAS domain S-box protein [Pusillimonas sp. MFBS29]MCC2595728.1 PAS domain S-box protein [Pusillimonas sp. MFBS29]
MSNEPLLAEGIIDQVSDALIYVDRAGNIARWNQAACALFGFSAGEMLGNGLDPIIPEHLRAAHWAGFNAAIEHGQTKLQGRPTLTRAVHKSGRKLYVEMTFALVKDDSGSAVGSVAMARDVTARVEKERAARVASTGTGSA